MERNHEFSDFLRKFSNAYSGMQYKQLRFLLFEHLTIATLSQKPASGMKFFNALERNGTISSKDVNILSEIAELTNNSDAKTYVAQYGTNSDKGKALSEFRKDLYKCLEKFTENASAGEQTDVDKLIGTYGLEDFDFKNKWDIIFYLERQDKLNPKDKDDMKKFIDSLNKGPAKTLKAYYPPEGQTDDSKAAASTSAAKGTGEPSRKGTMTEPPTSTVLKI